MKEKILSLLICFACLIGSYLYVDAGAILYVAGGLIVPLICIWFGGELASLLGPSGRRWLKGPSPTLVVKTIGWILLFVLPAMALVL